MPKPHLSTDQRDPAPKHAPSTYLEWGHADESEILSWAVKTAISDLGTELRHTDALAMRQDLHVRKRIFLMLLNRLMAGWLRTGDPGRDERPPIY
jgi:hypothetical protein